MSPKYKIQLLLYAFVLLFNKMNAQNGSITIEPNFNLPSCQSCTTLHAVTTPITGSGGTGSYTVVQNAYNPYPYVGTNFLTVGGNFGGIPDDKWSTVVNIPFTFCFFNNSYTNCIVGQNGQIGFDISQALGYNNWSLFGVTLPNNNVYYNNTIMGALFDIYPFVSSAPAASSITTETYGSAPNRVFVVSFNSNPMFSCTSTYITQQIVLHEGTNIIDVNIQSKGSCSWNSGLAIEGIQNNNASLFYTVPGRNGTAWTATNDSWSFLPQGGGSMGGVNPTSIDWYDLSNNAYLGSGDTMQVCPTTSNGYYAKATYDLCGSQVILYDTVLINKLPPLNISVNSITDANCYQTADGAINFSVTGGSNSYTYTINGNSCSTNPTGLTANTYTIIATDSYNCTESTIVTVGQPTELELSVVSNKDVLCKYQNTGQVHLLANGSVPSYTYWYDNNSETPSPNFDTLFSGNYMFHVKDSHGCLDSVSVFVDQPDSLLNVSLTATIATCINKHDGTVTAIPEGGVPNYSFEWNTNPPQYSQTATGLETGVYHVLVTDANGCITATQMPVEQQLCCQLFLPDAFTPNGDGHNDVYRVNEYGGGIILGEFKIYNRWGQEIFSTREISKGWDGTFKGVDQNSDSYYYILSYQCNDKGIISQKIAKGNFILIR